MMRSLSRLFVAAALAALAAPALAQTATLQINANVQKSCRVQTANPTLTVAWDVYVPGSEAATANVVVRCTKGTQVEISANGGGNAAAVAGFNRAVSDGSSFIGYKLSLASGGADLANSGAAVGTGFTSTGKNADISIPIFVTLDTAADPAAAAYTDSVVLTYTAL